MPGPGSGVWRRALSDSHEVSPEAGQLADLMQIAEVKSGAGVWHPASRIRHPVPYAQRFARSKPESHASG